MSDTVRETEDYLHEQLFGAGPKSVGEAVTEEKERRAVPAATPPEDAPIVVEDEPPTREAPEPTSPPETPPEPEEGEPEEEPEPPEDEGVVWAKRKYGEDVSLEKVARAAYEQERHISQLAREKREADELATQWYEYAQQAEQQASQQLGAAMPLSAQEENWVEQSLSDPLGYARTAALNGKAQLYQGVINRVAEENPGLAASIGTQVQMELASYAQQQPAQQQMSLEQALSESFQRTGLNVQRDGARMAEKIGELGEYHPYVRAIMGADPGQRDLAVQAVNDLVRATSFTPRPSQRDANIAKENELRRDASSVQTGGIASPPAPTVSPLLAGMTEEWKRRGQWQDD